MQVKTLVEPTVEPVTLAQAKLHARVDIDDDDTLINIYIKAARRYCEKYCGISFITQTKAIYYNQNDLDFYDDEQVRLPVGPIQSITSYTNYAEDGTGTVVDSGEYFLSSSGNVIFNSSYSWPDDIRNTDSFKIIAVVGFGATADSVPEEIKEAILCLTAHYYQHREALAYDSVNGVSVSNIPFSVTALLAGYKEYVI